MKVKVFSDELILGMYISELDHPWIESPFLFQGFEIHDDDELNQVKSTCDYVYVDNEKSKPEAKLKLTTLTASHLNVETKKKPKFTNTTSLKKADFDKDNFSQNLIRARKSRDKTRKYIDEMLSNARTGEIINTSKAKLLVTELANNIVENLDASMWLTQLKLRDEYTAIHSLNVCVLSLTFGRALGLPLEELNEIGLGALLHDIGKMRVPLRVLNKPGKLTKDEFEIMKSHPGMGYELVREDKNLSANVLTIIRSHHERLSGHGYPDKLSEEDITYYTKIVSITDVYDAITSDRCYHDGMTPHDALKSLYEWMPNNFDSELIQSFIRTIGIYPVGSVVELHSGHIGIVVKLNEQHRLKSVVMLVINRDGEFYSARKLINLASSVWDKNKHKPGIKRISDPKEYNIDIKKIIDEESL